MKQYSNEQLTISSTASLMADIANTASRGITVVKGVRDEIWGTSYGKDRDANVK